MMRRGRKQRVLWFGDTNRDFFYDFGTAFGVPPVTSFVPLIADETQADVGLTLAKELGLGGPAQGTMQGALVGQAFSLKRFLAHLSYATELFPNPTDPANAVAARHIVVRFGICKAQVDEDGVIVNPENFELAGTARGSNDHTTRLGVLSRQSRWVWLHERIITNYLARSPTAGPWGNGATGTWCAYPGFAAPYGGPWSTVGGRFAYPHHREVSIDLGPLGTAGPEERWFLARYAADAEATQASYADGGKVDIRYHWNPRVLIARSSKYGKKPGV